jgi:hypothetical protein
MASQDEELIGEATVKGVVWRVTRVAGMFRIWNDGTDPRYVISADVPGEVFGLMANAVAPKDDERSAVQLGPDLDFLDVSQSPSEGTTAMTLERSVREARDETEFP